MSWDIVIPAGGAIKGPFAECAGTHIRALAPVGPGAVPVLQRVVDAWRHSGHASRIIVAAPESVQAEVTGVDIWLPDQGSGPRNAMLALNYVGQDQPAFVSASDLPFLTGDDIADYVERVPTQASFAVGLVNAERYLTKFPSSPDSQFTLLRDVGLVTASGIFLVEPRLLLAQTRLLERIFNARKSQWRVARLVGVKIIMQMMTNKLTTESVTARVSTIFGGETHIIHDAAPSLAYDIDTVEDYKYADARLRNS